MVSAENRKTFLFGILDDLFYGGIYLLCVLVWIL